MRDCSFAEKQSLFRSGSSINVRRTANRAELPFVSESGAHNVIFEAFEGSAVAENVLASANALEWHFPGTAVAIPLSLLQDASFRENLASFLAQASGESIKSYRTSINACMAGRTDLQADLFLVNR